ncbi:MAG: hypothetical protein J2P32_11945, partial [Actinobacteria bacterium]|nr:hypothetical protein [Actinomycetota bacterium]
MGPVGSDQVWQSSARLADGREIIYFDESPGTGRAAIGDRRDLRPPAPGPDAGGPQPRGPCRLNTS